MVKTESQKSDLADHTCKILGPVSRVTARKGYVTGVCPGSGARVFRSVVAVMNLRCRPIVSKYSHLWDKLTDDKEYIVF